MDVDRVLVLGNSLCDHDHPIPRFIAYEIEGVEEKIS